MAHETLSYCDECLAEVPAVIHTTKDGVVIDKLCAEHGASRGLVERDPEFYRYIKSIDRGTIYNGIFVDVTADCNLTCKYCYHDKIGGDVAVNKLEDIARQYWRLAPFFLTGGEPTVHSQFFRVLRMFRNYAPVVLVTNGTMTADAAFCREVVPYLDHGLGSLALGLSLHPESGDAISNTLDNLARLGVKAGSLLCVIESLDEIPAALGFFDQHRHAIDHVRLKIGTQLWSEGKQSDLFISDIYHYLKGARVIESEPNKTSFVNVSYKDDIVRLVGWYNRTNVDLVDICCPPYYIAKDGTVNNLVVSCIKNEARA